MKNFDEKKFIAELLKTALGICLFFAEDSNAMWEIWKKLV